MVVVTGSQSSSNRSHHDNNDKVFEEESGVNSSVDQKDNHVGWLNTRGVRGSRLQRFGL